MGSLSVRLALWLMSVENKNLFCVFRDDSLWALKRDVHDHFPLLLKYSVRGGALNCLNLTNIGWINEIAETW